MEKIIGIDLGTSNSAAAVLVGGRPAIVPSAEGMSVGGKMFPSCVAFTKNGDLLVGEPARRQAVTNPEGTIIAVKRKMGADVRISVYGKEYMPQEISAFILQKIKRDAEAFLGEPVEKAVVTVPAYFNDNQRTATKEAGTIAGLDVVRIINEPTAASLAYGLDRLGSDQKILVFDLGGGTLDVTIIDHGEGVFEVVSTSGDTQLGGTDMDDALIDHVAKEFKREQTLDVRDNRTAVQRVREAAERAKIELSTVLETEITLPFLVANSSGPKHLIMKLTRSTLEDIVRPLVERCGASIKQALDDANLSPKEIDKVILVGGPTRMPIVRKFVEDYFGKTAERGLDPMECVAIGAAIQGGVIAGDVKDLILLDVTPLSLGVETIGGVLTKVIDRNTTIPTRRTQMFTTAKDKQVSVEISVLQGERPMAQDNICLGRFVLVGIPAGPMGVPQIEVTFDIDANGILHVSAKDLGTGREQKITISGSTRLTKEQIDKMKTDAERFADEDDRKKGWAVLRNRAESLIYSSLKTIKDLSDKIAGSAKDRVKESAEKLRASLKEEDRDAVEKGIDELTAIIHGITSELYGASSGAEHDKTAQADAGGATPESSSVKYAYEMDSESDGLPEQKKSESAEDDKPSNVKKDHSENDKSSTGKTNEKENNDSDKKTGKNETSKRRKG